MGQRLLLVNPVPKRKVSPKRRKPPTRRGSTKPRRKPVAKRRTAAQKRATAKMIAANRRRAKGRSAPTRAKRRSVKRRVKRNPATKTAQRRTYSRTAQMNPRRRKRSTSRRLRRNPITTRSIVNDMLMPAGVGAVGAIATDALFTYLPIPAQFKVPGIARYASKGLTAVALTWLASMVVQRKTAVQLGVGALTCLTAEIARNFMVQNVPALAPAAMEGMGLYTSSMGYYNPALPAGGGVNGMGVYVGGAETQQLPSLASRDTAGVAPGGMGMMDSHGYNYA